MVNRTLPEFPVAPARDDIPDAARLRRAAWASTTRRVRGPLTIAKGTTAPKAGDLFLARVDAIGYHSAIQLPDGRRKRLFVGDEIVLAYANRYAPSQFEAVVPKRIGPCQLVASGGIGARVLSWNASVTREPTQITHLAWLAGSTGAPANVCDYALPSVDLIPTPRPKTLVVVGTSMDSGKTQSAAFLVRGLSLAGLHVGYAKITGTGSGGDTWLLKDAGANPVVDFTDAGLASTYLEPANVIQRVFVTLMAHLIGANVDAIVLEVADGVLQSETAALLKSDAFKGDIDGILFTAGDAMGAIAGESWLRRNDLPLIALSGVLSGSPLLSKEASKATGLPVFTRQDLARAKTAVGILSLAKQPKPAGASTKAWRDGDGDGRDLRVLVSESPLNELASREEASTERRP